MAAERIVPSTTPTRVLQDNQNSISAVAVFPDRRRIVTGSLDKTLRLWDLKDGVVLKKMEGHRGGVRAVAVSQDGQFIASGDDKGGLIAWDGRTGELTKVIEAHSDEIRSLDFSPDSEVLASTGSTSDKSTKMWSTETWQPEGKPIYTLHDVYCARYSPSGELLVITTTFGATIYDPFTSDCVAFFSGDTGYKFLTVLAWTPDGGRLLSGGSDSDRAIREWDPSTWQQLGDPWNGHTNSINAIAVSPDGTLVASASADKHVRLWRLSDRRTIATFKHTKQVNCVTFSADGRHILSGGDDMKISEWAVPEDALPADSLKDQASTGVLDNVRAAVHALSPC
jgi:WD40 repeat protein